MLGILLIYWIGNKFYKLASLHNKSEWGWAIVAIVIYFASQFIIGIVLASIFPELFIENNNGNQIFLNVIGIAFGLIVWYAVFVYLERKWEREAYEQNEQFLGNSFDEIDQIGKEIS